MSHLHNVATTYNYLAIKAAQKPHYGLSGGLVGLGYMQRAHSSSSLSTPIIREFFFFFFTSTAQKPHSGELSHISKFWLTRCVLDEAKL